MFGLLPAARFLHALLYKKKKELEAICAIWSFPSPAPDCVVTVLGPNNQKAGSASNNLFCSPLPLPFLICFQELPLESG